MSMGRIPVAMRRHGMRSWALNMLRGCAEDPPQMLLYAIVVSGWAVLPEHLHDAFFCVQAEGFVPLAVVRFSRRTHRRYVPAVSSDEPKRRLSRPEVLSHIVPRDEIENQRGSARWVLQRSSPDDSAV